MRKKTYGKKALNQIAKIRKSIIQFEKICTREKYDD